ncbi:hypothetical protein J1N09_11865 [Aureitalea sp. L0-47]|uniref:hypothetical protein n=1 Tax=Aureitalea sp. L0-47 TaxID=2816962 RepID=UPI002237C4EA|nr:hypothetical protein [Aureitalea sp. L0-47]MCW5520542.1 hypothetical protein [Aureitalea sp. L0-47]
MNLNTRFIGIFMLLSLLSPLTVQTVHALDGHTHEICTDFSTHVHEQEIDCSIDLFQFSSFDFNPIDSEVEYIAIFIGDTPEITNLHITSNTRYANHLRGPPA